MSLATLRSDALEGLTGAATAPPQAVAFAAIAGAPPENGLRTATIPPVIAAPEVAEGGIACDAICPDYVLTSLVGALFPDTAKARGMTEDQVKRDVLLAAQWTRKFATVGQLPHVAQFLCTKAADNITGVALPVDGGWTAARQ